MYNITNEDFQLIEAPQIDFYTVRLMTGDWKDTVFKYNTVQLRVDDDEGHCTMSYDWQMVIGDPALEEDLKFNEYVGAVLQYIIQDAIDNESYSIGEKDKDGKTFDSDDNIEAVA